MSRSEVKRSFRQTVLNLFHDGQLSHSEKSVLMTLATFLGHDGLYPAHATLAKACRYSVRTVVRSLNRAYELGLVVRCHRFKREGGKRVRDSNSYQLVTNAAQRATQAGKHMARAVFHQSDRMAQKASNSLFNRDRLRPQAPQMTHAEMLQEVMSWVKPVPT